jgi:hypothetical protein
MVRGNAVLLALGDFGGEFIVVVIRLDFRSAADAWLNAVPSHQRTNHVGSDDAESCAPLELAQIRLDFSRSEIEAHTTSPQSGYSGVIQTGSSDFGADWEFC